MKDIPSAVIARLPKYYRLLSDLLDQKILRISSKELSDISGFTASQIRQDLNHFGEFGQQGYGYQVPFLQKKIGSLLGVDNKTRAVLVGNSFSIKFFLKSTLFSSCGTICLCAFDTSTIPFDVVYEGTPIYSISTLSSFIKEKKVEIAVLACYDDDVDTVVNLLQESTIKGVLNFTNKDLQTTNEISFHNLCLQDALLNLNYTLQEQKKENDYESSI